MNQVARQVETARTAALAGDWSPSRRCESFSRPVRLHVTNGMTWRQDHVDVEGGGVTVRRVAELRSRHLRFPTRVSRCGGIDALS